MEIDRRSNEVSAKKMADDFLDKVNSEREHGGNDQDEEISRLVGGPDIGEKKAPATGVNSSPIKNLRPQFRSSSSQVQADHQESKNEVAPKVPKGPKALEFRAPKSVKPTKKSSHTNGQRVSKGAHWGSKRLRGRQEHGQANRSLEERISKMVVDTRNPETTTPTALSSAGERIAEHHLGKNQNESAHSTTQSQSAPVSRRTNGQRTNIAACNETVLRLKLLEAQLEARDAVRRTEAAERRELERKAADEKQIATLVERRVAEERQRATLAEQQLANAHAQLNQAQGIIASLEDNIRASEAQSRSMLISNSQLLRYRPSRHQYYDRDPRHFH